MSSLVVKGPFISTLTSCSMKGEALAEAIYFILSLMSAFEDGGRAEGAPHD